MKNKINLSFYMYWFETLMYAYVSIKQYYIYFQIIVVIGICIVVFLDVVEGDWIGNMFLKLKSGGRVGCYM